MSGKVLLVASFGTTYATMRERAIDTVEAHVAAAFPDRQVRSAWTSTRVVSILKERGEQHDTLDAALERLDADGVDDVVVQPTCLMYGREMRKIEQAVGTWARAHKQARVRLGAPLLASEEDRRQLAGILAQEFADMAPGHMAVLMGHGSRDGNNEVYAHMNDEFERLNTPIYVATVEGQPTVDDMLRQVEQHQPTCVRLTPLMIVAGGHAMVDMIGDSPDSWQNLLRARGFLVEPIVRGLGEYERVRELVAQHARDAALLESATGA